MTTPLGGSPSSFPQAPLMQRPLIDAPRPMFSTLAISASGLSAQRVRMDVIAQNLANAETTRTPQGGPYHRRIVNLEAVAPETSSSSISTTTSAIGAVGAAASAAQTALANATTSAFDAADDTGGVRVASIGEDKTDGPMLYDPGHPDADKNGYVKMPNVNITDEMIDLMNARRVYEANATVFQVARAMLHKAIDL
jgi:flagellar basal-body rod protein FlgC